MLLPTISNRQERTDYDRKNKEFPLPPGKRRPISRAHHLTIGAYYAVIKAGIPYQDAPLELQIQYTVHSGIGKELCKTGLFTLLYGIAFLLISRLLPKKHS